MNLPEFKYVKSFDNILASAERLRICEEYVFIRDDGPVSQKFCLITIMAYTLPGKGHRGACALVRRGYLLGDNVIKHDGLYFVENNQNWKRLKHLPLVAKQYAEVGGVDQRRNTEFRTILWAAHKHIINDLRDTNWWLAAYAKRKKDAPRWSTNLIAKWRVPKNKQAEVRFLEREQGLEKRKNTLKHGWLYEAVPVNETETGGA